LQRSIIAQVWPGLHICIAQHGCPVSPQATTIPPWQTMPVPAAWPSSTQPLATQQAGSAQWLFTQHACPGAPHGGPQLPLAHIAPFMHVAAGATQRSPLLSQHAPPPHIAPAQQRSPAPPQGAQTSPPQASPALHDAPAQHGCPAPPHTWHTLFAQPTPAAVQVSPQHGWPAAPHAAHVPPMPPMHATLGAVHAPLLQQD
jgi:hypothetical protein